MTLNFCTLFNSAYLARGIVMYRSLLRTCSNFHLYVFAFDRETADFLLSASFAHLTVITLSEFEDPQLLAVKNDRSATEYCWTCTASTVRYCIRKYDLSNCTYVDADLEFYADPAILWNEMGENSVMITSHNYTKAYDQSAESGIYCVQFVSFRNDANGMKVLESWRSDCLEWCYARTEEGRFGDQKYLDFWQEKFSGVHVVENKGAGIAPWNLQQFLFTQTGDNITAEEKTTGKKFPVIFFHFHGVKFYTEGIVSPAGSLYDIPKQVMELFYKPYVRKLVNESKAIRAAGCDLDANGAYAGSPAKPMNPLLLLKYYLYDLRRSFRNITGKNLRHRISHHYYYFLNEFIS